MEKAIVERKANGKELRAIYAQTLVDLAAGDPRIVDLEADLMGAGGMGVFKQAHPGRLIDVGIAEQSMVAMAAGLSFTGFIPFLHTFGPFATRRPCDQVYISCAYAGANVKICGSDPGVAGTLNGGTHQAMEDVALLRPIPNITILEPCDHTQMEWAVRTAAKTEGLFYIRMFRKPCDQIYAPGSGFALGRGEVVREGGDAVIFTCGVVMMRESLAAADLLVAEGVQVRVVDLFSVKPLDRELVARCARETGAVVTAENHFAIGGLHSAVSEVLAEEGVGAAYGSIGVRDRFGEVGQLDELLQSFGMTARHIAAKVRETLARKH